MASAAPDFDMTAFLTGCESDLDPRPLFPVQEPDGKRDWSEAARQARFFRELRDKAPTLHAFHVPNAGRRNPMIAVRDGIVGGVFDVSVLSGMVGLLFSAFVEFKGYDGRGRAGRLSRAQIDWGNARYLAGHHVAMFFCPFAAVEWIRGIAPAAFLEGAR